MSYTALSAHVVYDPESAKEKILTAADGCDFETRPLADALGVSYPTLLRVLRRLGIRDDVRARWLDRRKANREGGRARH